jgi:hypothetical protein
MRAHEIVARLEGFRGRGPGTDAERRAANWLASELNHPRRDVRIEPFWCRPNWAAAHAWHVALAIAGSLVSVSNGWVGAALLFVALLSIAADDLYGVSLGRRLTRERASQNVVARSRPRSDAAAPALRLVITANYDAPRTGLVYRDRFRAIRSTVPAAAPGWLGWLGWLSIGTVWLLVVAVLRAEGHRSTPIGIAQFVPTALLVLGFAALLDLATSDYAPAANDNGTGTAVAMALVRALDAAPPRHMQVDLLLQGAGESGAIGLRKHLRRRATSPGARTTAKRRHTRELDRTNAAVIAFAACGSGTPRWWTSDGSLLPLRYSRRLRQLSEQISEHGAALPHRGRGTTPAFPARVAAIPAITLGCLDTRGLAPRSHQPDDVAAAVDPGTLDATLEFGLILVDALDSFLATTRQQAQAPPSTETVAHAVPHPTEP